MRLTAFFADIEHKFNDNWKLKGILSRTKTSSDEVVGYAYSSGIDKQTGKGALIYASRWDYEPTQDLFNEHPVLGLSKEGVEYNVEHLKESNKFKYELIQHQQKLIKYQDVMISSLGDVLWNEYGYDLPQFDGEEQDNIDIEKEIIDSLYKSQQ